MSELPRVTVVGSLHTDLIASAGVLPTLGTSVLGDRFTISPGGKAANQAAQLARLGVRTWLVSAVGHDAFGEQISSRLRGAGADLTYLERREDQATGASTIIAVGGEYASVIVPGASAALSDLTLRRALPAIARSSFVVTQLELGVRLTESALHLAREQQATTVLNVSPIGRHEPTGLRRTLSLADVIVVNCYEAGQLAGITVSDRDGAVLAARILGESEGATAVVVTCGADGAVLIRGEEVTAHDSFPIIVADSVGAGDAFLGGLLAGWCEGGDDYAALRLGSAVGALCASGYGAFDSLPDRAQVREFLGPTG